MHMNQTQLILLILGASLTAVGCLAPTTSIEEARTAYFSTVDGSDDDCEGWLDWCINEGYPQADCEERNQYCVDGEWVGGDGENSDDPCAPVADAAYNDCLEGGGSAKECREVAAEAYEDCAGE